MMMMMTDFCAGATMTTTATAVKMTTKRGIHTIISSINNQQEASRDTIAGQIETDQDGRLKQL